MHLETGGNEENVTLQVILFLWYIYIHMHLDIYCGKTENDKITYFLCHGVVKLFYILLALQGISLC